jgi:hypothetical protein
MSMYRSGTAVRASSRPLVAWATLVVLAACGESDDPPTTGVGQN